MRSALCLVAGLLVALGGGAAQDDLRAFAARVVGVVDGDTLSVLRDGEEVTIRILGIDAPERGQAFSEVAREWLSTLALGEAVYVHPKQRDQYDRLVARVVVGDRDLAQQMVLEGLAWHYADHASGELLAAIEILAALQRDAQAAKRGIWVDPSNRAPWEYREAQRARPAEESREAAVVRASPTKPAPSAKPNSSIVYHGNTSSKIFHAPWCQHYDCKNCTRVFRSREEAIRAGYRPGGQCKP